MPTNKKDRMMVSGRPNEAPWWLPLALHTHKARFCLATHEMDDSPQRGWFESIWVMDVSRPQNLSVTSEIPNTVW